MPTRGQRADRVLYVGAEPDCGAVAALVDCHDRFDVVTERSVAAARERLAADDAAVDCVLARHELPDGDGLDLLSAVREDHGELPFVLYTDAGSEQLASQAIAAGVTDYVRRDPDGDGAVLADRIETAVEARRTRLEQRRQLDAIETAAEGISILDEDGRYVYVNRAYADLYGYDRSEMLGEHWRLIYPDDEVDRAENEILPTVDEEGVWHGETTGLRADGTTFVEDHTVARTAGGDLVCTVRDVTEQRERERTLEAQRRELELKDRAMDAAPVGIVITDPDREDNPVVYCNERFQHLTGYDEAEVLGRNCRFLQGPDTGEAPVAELRRAVDAAEPTTVELRNYRKDGTEFWNRVSVAPVRDRDDEVANYVGFQEDVTERREPARQLRVLHRVLRHNLANSMNLVRGMAEVVADRADGEASATARDIVEEVDDLLSTVDRHRAVVQLLSDPPDPRAMAMAPVLRGAVASATDGVDAAVAVEGDDDARATAIPAIETAVEELVANAVRASASDPPSVTVTLSADETACRVRVVDDGPGLPPEEAAILTGEQDVDPLYHGIGMGLWLVYWVVTLSGGSVAVDADGEGTTVTVALPPGDAAGTDEADGPLRW